MAFRFVAGRQSWVAVLRDLTARAIVSTQFRAEVSSVEAWNAHHEDLKQLAGILVTRFNLLFAGAPGMHACMHACMHVCTHDYACMHVCVRGCVCVCLCMCMCMRMRLRVFVRLCVGMLACWRVRGCGLGLFQSDL